MISHTMCCCFSSIYVMSKVELLYKTGWTTWFRYSGSLYDENRPSTTGISVEFEMTGPRNFTQIILRIGWGLFHYKCMVGGGGGGGVETTSKYAYRRVDDYSKYANREVKFESKCVGWGPTRSGVFRMWGVHIKYHFISEINYMYLPIPGVHECEASYVNSGIFHMYIWKIYPSCIAY